MGVKGSWKRPSFISAREQELRYGYAFRPKEEEGLSWEEYLKLKGEQDVSLDKGELSSSLGDSKQ